ncbi:hypothetical protein [Caballeronia sp. RCC_10]|uniref:hypothetical protein n=1 Tax=Caballeronia sp. RCC_10 TaxID=3239227 RepID=UPI0035265FA0
MNTGNSAASGFNTAGVGKGDIKSECDELKEEADKEDRKIQAMRKTPKGATAHKCTTVTASKLTCGGVTTKKPAYSSLSRLPKGRQSRYAQGVKRGEPSKMCKKKNGEDFEHATQGFSSGCSHTEARLVEDAFKGPGGAEGCELMMKIKWKQRVVFKNPQGKITGAKNVAPLAKPCKDCEKVLCHAQYCGLKIFLCKIKQGRQEKVKPPPCKKHGY